MVLSKKQKRNYLRWVLVLLPLCAGLSLFFTNCGNGLTTMGPSGFTPAALKVTCSPGSVGVCVVGNGKGLQTCNSTGDGFAEGSVCRLQSCNAGFVNDGGVCKPAICAPNSKTIPCAVGMCSGFQSCNAAGTEIIGQCDTSVCNKATTPQNCTPNKSTVCSNATGTGSQLCNSAGTGLVGPCKFELCAVGYNLQDGKCVQNVCDPVFPIAVENPAYDCQLPHGIGSQRCNSMGSGFVPNTCVAKSCDPGYVLTNGVCYANVFIASSQQWVKPQGATTLYIECVGGGGSGDNPGCGGYPGVAVNTSVLRPFDAEVFVIQIGAAGADPTPAWGGYGNGGTTTITVNGVQILTAPGGLGTCGPEGTPQIPQWTISPSAFRSAPGYGTGGGGHAGSNQLGTYGATGGACRILY